MGPMNQGTGFGSASRLSSQARAARGFGLAGASTKPKSSILTDGLLGVGTMLGGGALSDFVLRPALDQIFGKDGQSSTQTQKVNHGDLQKLQYSARATGAQADPYRALIDPNATTAQAISDYNDAKSNANDIRSVADSQFGVQNNLAQQSFANLRTDMMNQVSRMGGPVSAITAAGRSVGESAADAQGKMFAQSGQNAVGARAQAANVELQGGQAKTASDDAFFKKNLAAYAPQMMQGAVGASTETTSNSSTNSHPDGLQTALGLISGTAGQAGLNSIYRSLSDDPEVRNQKSYIEGMMADTVNGVVPKPQGEEEEYVIGGQRVKRSDAERLASQLKALGF